jgi:hypothetical protein
LQWRIVIRSSDKHTTWLQRAVCAPIWLEQCIRVLLLLLLAETQVAWALLSPRTIVSTFPHTKYFSPACVTSVDFSEKVTLRKCLFCQVVMNEMTVNR